MPTFLVPAPACKPGRNPADNDWFTVSRLSGSGISEACLGRFGALGVSVVIA